MMMREICWHLNLTFELRLEWKEKLTSKDLEGKYSKQMCKVPEVGRNICLFKVGLWINQWVWDLEMSFWSIQE